MAHLVEEFGFRLAGHCWTRLHRSGSTVGVCSPRRERAECWGCPYATLPGGRHRILPARSLLHICAAVYHVYGHYVDSSGKKLQKAAWSGLNLFMWMVAVNHGKKWNEAT